ncbi:c-type cytochrome biogenesis protein CcmI [Wenxinia saemankumensis]|uniref:Cytochrome c-type biogenesis protein CcmH n=1 Tax=Wenxinia saemankumensis TaxID=1447782 RepID=A0A1M6AUE6_9RHOB|nr:c-type cytochrome biogenesis protein CcmI [Wenxinia saemankumensis]SHI39843.1 cytochrome c-type biogenesis protein CcmH [Wenxinia saemankumensis]
MLSWAVFALLALLVAAYVARPLLSAGRRETEVRSDVALYRAQLEEVDRDLARGTIGAEEAERARAEIARRLIAADRAGAARATEGPARWPAALAGLVVLAGGLSLYAVIGAPGAGDLPRAERIAASAAMRDGRMDQTAAEAEAAAMPQPPAPEIPEDYAALIERLRQIAPTRPDDIEGWRLLARHEGQLGNYAAAARAQEEVLRLRGDEAGIADRTLLADLYVAAASGYVSPEAEALVRAVLAEDSDEPAARYTLGLLYAQTDRPDLAFELWRPVAEGGDPASIHTRLARDQIPLAAQAAGIDYAPPAQRGPSAADIAAAEGMDPGSRQAMVEGMVAQLSTRLAEEGGPAEDWARLVTSLAVLGETERAAAILGEAREVFAASERDMAIIDAAAEQAGLDG